MKFTTTILALALFANLALSKPIQVESRQEKIEEQGALKLRETYHRKLAPKTIHVWTLSLETGQYIAVEAEAGYQFQVCLIDPRENVKIS